MESKSFEEIKPLIIRRRTIGIAGSALWMIAISACFLIWSLAVIGSLWAEITLVITIIVITVLTIFSIFSIKAAIKLPKDPPRKTNRQKKIGLLFVLVVFLEVAAISIVASIATSSGNSDMIPSLALIIVGIHFFPLAIIFHVPRYYLTGLLFCAIPAAMLLFVSKGYVIGDVQAWYILPSLGCGIVALLTAAANLHEVARTFSELKA